MEDALYEINSIRRFVGLNRFDRGIPDETSIIMRFRYLLEKHDLGQKLFERIREELNAHGLYLREGTIVDATIIQAPLQPKTETGPGPEIPRCLPSTARVTNTTSA